MRRTRALAMYVGTAVVVALSGCDEGDRDITEPPQTPAVSVTLASTSLSLTQGESATVTVSVARSGGFDGAVDLTLESAPAGVTGSFSPASVPAGSATSTLTLTAATDAATGSHNLSVRAAGQGTQDATGSLALTVLDLPSITLSVDPTSVSMVQNSSGTVSVNVARTNFTGDVQLSLSGAPAGVSGTFAPATLSGGATASTLTLSATAAAATGATTLTVTAQGAGVAGRSATIGLAVNATPSYTLSVNPTALTVPTAGTGTATVTLARTNFAGAVALSVTGAPAGATATISPATAEQNTATLTVNAGTAASGNYTLTITGTASGLEDRTATIALTIGAAGDYTLSLSPATITAAPGQTRTATVTATGSSGATGMAALSVSGAPAGVTVSLADSVSIDPGRGRNTIHSMGSTTMTVSVDPTAAPGSHTLTITANSAAYGTRTAQLELSIELAGGFTLSVSPSSLAILQGGSGSATVNVQRSGGFTGAVDLSVTGLPSGVTATLSPASTTGSTSTLQVAVSASAAAGTTALTIVGSAPGRPDRTASLSLQVAAATGSHNIQFCENEAPIWFAVQDGAGAWTQVPGVGNRYSFDISSGRGGVAFVTQSGNSFSTFFIFGTAADFTAGEVGAPSCGGKTVRGSFSPAGFGNPQASVALGTASRPPSLFTSFTLQNVPDGPHDLVASLAGFLGAERAHRVIVRRDVNPPDNSTLPVLDFGTVEAHAAEEYGLTINGLAAPNGLVQYLSYFITPSTPAPLFATPLGTGPEHRWHAVPEALRRESDLHSVQVVTVDAPNETRMVRDYFSGASDRTLTLGPRAAAPPTFSVVTATPYRRPRVVHNVDGNYASVTTIFYAQTLRSVAAVFSAAYVNDGTIDFTVPELTEAHGYEPTWGLRPQGIDAALFGEGWSGTSGGFAARPAAGVVTRGITLGVRIP